MNALYQILIPTRYGDNNKPIGTAHHKEWDKYVQSITGGLTIFTPARGKWINDGVEHPERIIPVMVMCKEEFSIVPDTDIREEFKDKSQINKIINFTIKHYRQKAVMFFLVTEQVQIQYAK